MARNMVVVVCCGLFVNSNMMAYILHLPSRNHIEQQELVTKGKFGTGNSKAELKLELHAHGIYDTDHHKDDLQQML